LVIAEFMKKMILLSCWCLLTSILVHAQGSTNNADVFNNKNWKAFIAIALSPTDHDAKAPVVQKWQSPIRYKIYGTTNNAGNDKKIAEYIELTFRKLAPLTGLDISSTEDDEQVNLFLLIGRPEEISNMTLPPGIKSFSLDRTESHCHYTASKNSYMRMLTYINPDDSTLLKNKKDDDQPNQMAERWNAAAAPPADNETGNMRVILINNRTNGRPTIVVAGKAGNGSRSQNDNRRLQRLWCEVRLMLMKSLGFNGVIDDSSSLFTNHFSQRLASQKIISADERIIKGLYNPSVKPGMTAQEVYAVSGNLFVK
jgi:hypothetical protein